MFDRLPGYTLTEPITSPANTRVKRALKLRKSRDRRKHGLFLTEGIREVSRAANAGLGFEEVFVCPALLGDEAERALAAAVDSSNQPVRPQVIAVEASLFTRMTYRQHPEGVLAVVCEPRWTLDQLPRVTEQTLLLVAVGTAKPGNLGAMVRTADAAGASAVLSPDLAVDRFHPNAIRASTGAVFSLPMVQAEAHEVIHWLNQQRIRIVPATPHGPVNHTQADLTGPLALVIGAEDVGLDQTWLDAAQSSQNPGTPVRIATHGNTTDSLNASNAAAVLLFEALRQRTAD